MTIRAISFDVDGTLYSLRGVQRRLRGRSWRRLKDLQFLRAWRELRAISAFEEVREELRREGEVEGLARVQYERTAKKLGRGDGADVERTLQEVYHMRWIQAIMDEPPDPEVRATLKLLLSRGFRIACLSDFPVRNKLIALGLADLPWAAQICCEEAGALKPHPKAFRQLCERLKLAPAEVAHVGDRAQLDVLGALEAGMEPVLLGAAGQDGAVVRPRYRVGRFGELAALPIFQTAF